MASLLELVDSLIGDVLAGNIYTNVDTYANALRTPLQSPTGIAHLHADSNVIPSPPHGPPQLSREGIYQFGAPPPGIEQQIVSSRDLTLERPPSTLDTRDHTELASKFHELRLSRNAINTEPANSVQPSPHGLIRNDFSDAHRLGNLYDDEGPKLISDRGGEYAVRSFGLLKGLDVFVIAHWFRNIGREFGILPIQDNNVENKVQRPSEMIAKGITFAASNFLLAALNPGDVQSYGIGNQIFNPLALFAQALPVRIIDGIPLTHITFATPHKEATLTSEITETSRLLLMRKGIYVKSEVPQAISQLRSPDAGFLGDIAQVGPTPGLESGKVSSIGFNIEDQAGEGTVSKLLGVHTNVYTPDVPYGPENAILPLRELHETETPHLDKLKALFIPARFPGGSKADFDPFSYTFINKSNVLVDGSSPPDYADAPGLNAAVTDAALTPEDAEEGVLSAEISDDQIYMPFMFEDLRDNPATFLYFRAFLKGGLAETFVPDWEISQYYGRVDNIPIYKSTIRTVNVSFDVVAWSVKDLKVIYKKLQKLQSMVYPEYDIKGFLKKGPIVRMRIGDIFAAEGKKGIPGYITALDFSYDDGVWDVEEDTKVPRNVSVSLGYTVIHDGNPGIYPFSQWNIAEGSDSPNNQQGGRTFGVLSVLPPSDPAGSSFKVSEADIRRIFKTVKNGSGG